MCIRDRPGTQPEQQVLDALGEEELTAMILDLREPYRTPCRLVLLEQHTMAEAARPVSYTHLDVYKRQVLSSCCPCTSAPAWAWGWQFKHNGGFEIHVEQAETCGAWRAYAA